ncbi:TPA: ClpX C4-type zinc finger protein [Enterobacter cloacae]
MAIHSEVYEWRQIPQREPDPKTVCNFCKQVTAEDGLIAGPGVNICTECVGLCNEIFADRQAEYRSKTIEDIAKTLCTTEETLTVERAITLAGSIFDAGYRKDNAG